MRVLLLASFAPSLWLFRAQLVRDLQEQGCEVWAAVPCNEEERDRLRRMGLHVACVPLARTGRNPWRDARYLAALVRLMRRLRPAKVLAYTIKPVLYGAMAARMAGVPFYALITGLGVLAHTGQGRLLRPLVRRALLGAEGVFFQNPDDRRDLGFAEDFGVLVPGSGVDLQHFQPAPMPSMPPLVFLFVGRFLRAKGIGEFAEAARIVQARLGKEQVRFQIAGWRDASPDAVSEDWLVRQTHLENLGMLADVRPAIAGAHVFVLPSYREGTPRSVLEAMAMARPIITTDAPGCRETVRAGENGWLVPVRDAKSLAEAMEAAWHARDRLAAMGMASRRMAEARFDARKVSRMMLKEMGLWPSG